MYRLLLIAPSNEATDQAYWKTQNFDPVEICPDLHSAGERLASKKYDAVGVPDSSSYTQLKDILAARNDCIPAFILPSDQQESRTVLRDVKHLLNRLHVDYFDGQYSLNELSRMIQYEMLHNLLAGKSNDAKRLIRWFGMLRSDIPVSKPCRVYSLSLPNGDLYLEDRWHHGQQRLQKALERNFFSHIEHVDYCAVAFLSPVDARLMIIPDVSDEFDSLTDQMDSAVIRCVNEIKSYLDLDIDVCQAGTAACISDIALLNNSKEE